MKKCLVICVSKEDVMYCGKKKQCSQEDGSTDMMTSLLSLRGSLWMFSSLRYVGRNDR